MRRYLFYDHQLSADQRMACANHRGLREFTGLADDEGKFRTPTLRNIALTAPYFHTGKVWNLDEAVTVMAKTQLGKTLPQQEVSDIVAFLRSLTGDQPKTSVPALPPVTGTSARPVD